MDAPDHNKVNLNDVTLTNVETQAYMVDVINGGCNKNY